MRLKFTFIFLLIVSNTIILAQPINRGKQPPIRNLAPGSSNNTGKSKEVCLTGIWRGYFKNTPNSFNSKVQFEVQIDEAKNKSLKGVTYSYKSTVFYAKASLQGLYMASSNNLIFSEIKMLEQKIADNSEPCLMTCYLEYTKMGNLETLEGTYTSVNINDKGDCGPGIVYLEKVAESDFYKEDFLVNREHKNENVRGKKIMPLNSVPNFEQKRNVPPVVKNSSPPVIEPKKIPVPAEPPAKAEKGIAAADPKNAEPQKEITKPVIPTPKIIKERENAVVKVLTTNSPNITIQLYDNGQIDHDTISVYHNNELVVSRKMLSYQPITINIKSDILTKHHEFVMVAENLGEIPPNTALMVITSGGKRHELFITSTEQKNAKVIVEYTPNEKDSK